MDTLPINEQTHLVWYDDTIVTVRSLPELGEPDNISDAGGDQVPMVTLGIIIKNIHK